jgi:hypothetical protein
MSILNYQFAAHHFSRFNMDQQNHKKCKTMIWKNMLQILQLATEVDLLADF